MENSIWTHNKTGNRYRIILFANTAGDRWPIIVVYDDTNGNTWARPDNEWYDRYTIDDNQDDMEFF